MKIIWKGQIIDEKDKDIDLHDRGYQFGDGLYEVTRVYNGKLFTAQEHLDRLFFGAQKIELDLGFTSEQCVELMEKLIEANDFSDGYIYLQITRGDGILRNHVYPQQPSTVFSGFALPVERPVEWIQNGIKAITLEDKRWLHCDIKSLSLMGNVMAKNAAIKQGADEVIQHRDGWVTEGASSNVLIVKDNVIYTRPDGPEILPGITKLLIKQLALAHGIEYREEVFSLQQLLEADEVWMSNSVMECVGVIAIDNQPVGSGDIGPLCRKIQSLYLEKVTAACGPLN